MQTKTVSSDRQMRGLSVVLLFTSALLTAGGYGATFLLTEHFRALGGSEIETGRTLGGAMVGTFIGVSLVGWTSDRFGGARLAAIGGLLVAVGYVVLGSLTSITSLVSAAGLLIGLGWGMFYLAAPMGVSERVTDVDRGYWFTRYGAFLMAGIGGGPVAALVAVNTLGFSTAMTLRLVALACAMASICMWLFDMRAPRPRQSASSAAAQPLNWLTSLAPLAATRAIYPIAMVGLGACVFTGMMTFQSSLVRATSLDPSLYFTIYTAVVVLARFTLAPAINRADGDRMSILLLVLMAAGVLAFFAIRFGTPVQAVSAILLGLGYGLVYSVIQTQVVNDAPEAYRTAALTWFGVSYFIGIFGFPVLAGWLIVRWGTTPFLAIVFGCALAELALALVRARAVERAGGKPLHEIAR